ncbi:hypothetical protein [Streptomyces sp. NPDC020951]|uniref:hypothetical protein n=1 Tax=Streptomyces sp. NPDC020951 TaxID=3365104 RepID=UPI0037B12094
MAAVNMKIAAVTMLGISVSAAVAGCSATDEGGDETQATSSYEYKDGTYRATGQYGNGPSSITVSLTLDGDEITAVEVTPRATDPTSLGYQERFADAVPELVVGKDIDEVDLDRVAGSSGTPDGFNAALRQIKDQASG